MVVWVDVDEVLAHFRTMFNLHLKKKFKIKVDKHFVSKDWYYSDIIPAELVFKDLMDALPENWTEHQKIYPGAKEFLLKLKSMGCHIVMITHVPQEQSHYRIKNLVKNGLYFDEIYFTGLSKTLFSEQIAKRYSGPRGQKVKHFFIDDRAKNVVEFLDNMDNVACAVTLNVEHNAKDINIGKKFKDRFVATPRTQQEMYQEILKAVKASKK